MDFLKVSRPRFSHTFRFLPPELERHFTPASHSSPLPLFPTFLLVWCYLPRVRVMGGEGGDADRLHLCWNTEQIAASEGLLCYYNPLYQTQRMGGKKKKRKSSEMTGWLQSFPDYMHNRLNRPTSICAKKAATPTRHLQTKIMFFMALLALGCCLL